MTNQCSQCKKPFNINTTPKNRPFVFWICSETCLKEYLNRSKRKFKVVDYKINEGFGMKTLSGTTEFRSIYERKVAQWFKDHRISFEYEKYQFFFNGRSYIPDFFLPKSNIFVEVKGLWEGKAYGKFKEFFLSNNIYLIDKGAMQTFGMDKIKIDRRLML